MKNEIIIYQSSKGEIEFKGDLQKETLWANLQQIADLFETDKSGISRHINNIYRLCELVPEATVAKIATVQTEGKRQIRREIIYYNLDLILSVGYRVNSKTATKFRQWATKTLRQYILQGFTINRKRIAKNYSKFFEAVESVKKLLPESGNIKTEDALELVKMFANTWLSLDAYDKAKLPTSGITKRQVKITAEELIKAIAKLKQNLLQKNETTELFAQERTIGGISGIVGNIFQTFDRKELYPTLEEKAAHLLYFTVKNHPFVDGNKRSGAFAFVWYLSKSGLLNKNKLTPEAMAALTLLIAESNPKDKEKMIGLVLQLI